MFGVRSVQMCPRLGALMLFSHLSEGFGVGGQSAPWHICKNQYLPNSCASSVISGPFQGLLPPPHLPGICLSGSVLPACEHKASVIIWQTHSEQNGCRGWRDLPRQAPRPCFQDGGSYPTLGFPSCGVGLKAGLAGREWGWWWQRLLGNEAWGTVGAPESQGSGPHSLRRGQGRWGTCSFPCLPCRGHRYPSIADLWRLWG